MMQSTFERYLMALFSGLVSAGSGVLAGQRTWSTNCLSLLRICTTEPCASLLSRRMSSATAARGLGASLVLSKSVLTAEALACRYVSCPKWNGMQVLCEESCRHSALQKIFRNAEDILHCRRYSALQKILCTAESAVSYIGWVGWESDQFISNHIFSTTQIYYFLRNGTASSQSKSALLIVNSKLTCDEHRCESSSLGLVWCNKSSRCVGSAMERGRGSTPSSGG